MAGKLQELSAFYDRIIFVSFLSHHKALHALLRESGVVSAPATMSDMNHDIQVLKRVSLTNLIQTLDDFPKVSQRYEEQRRTGEVGHFDKLVCLLSEVRDFCRQFGVPWRQLAAFERMLPGMCAEGGRVTPRMREVIEMAAACFPENAIGPLRSHLFTYFDSITLQLAAQIGPERQDTDE